MRRSTALTAVGLLIAVAGCEPGAESATTRPSPNPEPPSMWSASYSFDGRYWSLSVVLDTGGRPTALSVDWGSGSRYDASIAMGTFDETGRRSLVTSSIPSTTPVCLRFRAVNELGAATADITCTRAPAGT